VDWCAAKQTIIASTPIIAPTWFCGGITLMLLSRSFSSWRPLFPIRKYLRSHIINYQLMLLFPLHVSVSVPVPYSYSLLGTWLLRSCMPTSSLSRYHCDIKTLTHPTIAMMLSPLPIQPSFSSFQCHCHLVFPTLITALRRSNLLSYIFFLCPSESSPETQNLYP